LNSVRKRLVITDAVGECARAEHAVSSRAEGAVLEIKHTNVILRDFKRNKSLVMFSDYSFMSKVSLKTVHIPSSIHLHVLGSHLIRVVNPSTRSERLVPPRRQITARQAQDGYFASTFDLLL
jgi:hypothetical protein